MHASSRFSKASRLVRPATSILLVVVLIAIAGCRSPRAAPANMVWIAGGTFWMGCEGCGMPDALPAHRVSQQARQRRPLSRLGTAETLFRRG